ncbi:hypothetical protein MTER_42730 [Mycolicibacter terrae]|uniref:Acyl-CoA synthetase n=3 Tax=Mycolicibacter terrae TaxID=1788 RepID=A0AAD1I0A5_9MYCO|nr:hypothetical protein MTER_42730 [Mycolicibacter terrae]
MRIPTTTSGKIQRSACRDQYVAGELAVLAQWEEPRPQKEGPGVGNALLSGLARLAVAGLAQRRPGSQGDRRGED